MPNPSPSSSSTYIRTVTLQDVPALSRICLLTGDAGHTAEHLHTLPDILGTFYAIPYATLPHTFGFVLVDPAEPEPVGYVLGASDTRAFERNLAEDFLPPIHAKYTPMLEGDSTLTEADRKFVRMLAAPHMAAQASVTFSPAHLHIDILPAYQRQGWGRRLIGRAVQHLQEGGLRRVWLGLDTRNDGAKRFYERLGFKEIKGAPAGVMGLEFDDWKD